MVYCECGLLVVYIYCSVDQSLFEIICTFCFIGTVSHGALRFYRNGLATFTQAWSSGIVQIYYSGTWGNICDDLDFGFTEADVVCHQLGYSGASSYTNTGYSSL